MCQCSLASRRRTERRRPLLISCYLGDRLLIEFKIPIYSEGQFISGIWSMSRLMIILHYFYYYCSMLLQINFQSQHSACLALVHSCSIFVLTFTRSGPHLSKPPGCSPVIVNPLTVCQEQYFLPSKNHIISRVNRNCHTSSILTPNGKENAQRLAVSTTFELESRTLNSIYRLELHLRMYLSNSDD